MPDSNLTKLNALIIPEVMEQMISGKVTKKLTLLPYVKVDNTLSGNEGDTVTIPSFGYIGDAVDVAEGEKIPTAKLTSTSKKYTIKKAAKGVQITDEAALSSHGDPIGEATTQLAKSIQQKMQEDAINELYKAKIGVVIDSKLGYNSIVDAIGVFEEEGNDPKVMFVHPGQVPTLRKDANFIANDRTGYELLVNGEIGTIANCRIVPSKLVKKFDEFYKADPEGTITIVNSGATGNDKVNLSDVIASLPSAKAGDKVTKVEVPAYFNPIIKLDGDKEIEDESPAITAFLKRDANVEKQRDAETMVTKIFVNKLYTVALTNETRVVIAKIKA